MPGQLPTKPSPYQQTPDNGHRQPNSHTQADRIGRHIKSNAPHTLFIPKFTPSGCPMALLRALPNLPYQDPAVFFC